MLGAETFGMEMRGVAVGAFGGDGDAEATIVATKAVGAFVIHEADVAMLASRCPFAIVADNAKREPSTVLEKNHLLMVGQCFTDLRDKEEREVFGLHLTSLLCLFHVDTHYFGQHQSPIALCHLCITIFASLGVVVAFQGWCGRPEDGTSAKHMGQIDGGIATLVSWRGLELFVGAVMFFVDNDKS